MCQDDRLLDDGLQRSRHAGGLALKWKWREKQRAAGRSTDRPNLITGPVQICWHKFARYFDVEIREVPMEQDRLLLSPEEVVKRCDENTIGVVPTLGVTFTLQYEPVQQICTALDALEERTGLDVPVHVDAASGGFLAPFVDSQAQVGFPPAAGQVDQRLRPQVSASPRWAADGSFGARSTTCRVT